MTVVSREVAVSGAVSGASDMPADGAYITQREADPSSVRRTERTRLFVVLAWAGGGVCATAALALSVAMFSQVQIGQVGPHGALSSVIVGMAVFAGVTTLAGRIDRGRRSRAHLLLWGTAGVDAALITVLESALARGDADIDAALSGFVASVAFAVGAAVLLVGCVACAIGCDGRRSTPLRWGAVLAFVAVPTVLVAPGVWWMGILGACLLAWTADGMLSGFRRRCEAAAPALAACAVAGIVALVLLVVCIASRDAVRFVMTAVESAPGA